MSQSTRPKVCSPVENLLRERGFRPGLPRHITPRSIRVDMEVCAQLRCPGCRCVGMTYIPFVRLFRYRVVAACLGCGQTMEV